MATRTIKDRKERLPTIMVLPFITCSARLPVYILLIGTFIPKGKIGGIIDQQALAFFFLYFLGTVVALVFAKLFRLSFFRGKSTSFVIELPHYQRPRLGPAWHESIAQAKIFLRKVGTIILFFSMVIWALSTFPHLDSSETKNLTAAEQAALSLEHSYIGKMGRGIEPLIKPLGFDWKMGVGILSAFAARELFVSTLGTIYALGDVDENSGSLRQRILKERDPKTGRPIYNLAVAWSLIIFFAFACQCMSTLAIARRESESRLFPLFMFSYMLLFAYVASWATYHFLV
jgi:ferrous iron transport protein B